MCIRSDSNTLCVIHNDASYSQAMIIIKCESMFDNK